MIQPLNQLQSKDQKWEWSMACQRAFESSKQALVSSSALTHYDATNLYNWHVMPLLLELAQF